MKTTFSLTLIVCLTATTLPIAAQQPTGRPSFVEVGGPALASGSLARAVEREAALFVLADPPASALDGVRRDDIQPQSNWSRVRALGWGTEVTVNVQGEHPGRPSGYVVFADEDRLAIVRTDPPVPAAAMRHLLERHSQFVLLALNSQKPAPRSSFIDDDVRVGSDGVFVGDRKVASLDEVILSIPRSNVTEIAVKTQTYSSTSEFLGVLGGAIGGAFAGGLIGNALEQPCRGWGGCYGGLGGGILGLFVGGIAGGVIGGHPVERRQVIYTVDSASRD